MVAPVVGGGQSHVFLFLLVGLVSLAELGVTVFRIAAGNEEHHFVGKPYHALLIAICFTSSWTVLFATVYLLSAIDGARRILADIASSICWLLITAVLWGITSGLMSVTRTGGLCPGREAISTCRQSLTIEALGWTVFSLTTLTLFITIANICIGTWNTGQEIEPGKVLDPTQKLV